MFATAAAGAFLLPSLLQLALIGGGLWLGATVAQTYFGGGGGTIDPDSTIDVEAYSVDDDWRNEMFQCAACPAASHLAGGVCRMAARQEAVRAGMASSMVSAGPVTEIVMLTAC